MVNWGGREGGDWLRAKPIRQSRTISFILLLECNNSNQKIIGFGIVTVINDCA
jgi:hypothetical protein